MILRCSELLCVSLPVSRGRWTRRLPPRRRPGTMPTMSRVVEGGLVGLFSRKSRDSRSDVERSRATYQRALALFDQKRWSEAADGFAEAAGADPDSSSCQLFLGVSLSNAGWW